MQILLTGARGYLGRPLAFQLSTDHKVVGIDNKSRESWVEQVVGKSQNILEIENENYKEVIGDLTNRDFVDTLIKIHKPDCIIHTAAQPSMPFSDLSWERACFTQTNNLLMNLNLLWAMRNNNLRGRYVIFSTTGVSGQNLKEIPEAPCITAAGSFYHTSKSFDSSNCSLAARQWGQEILEFRTSIVYGLQTNLLARNNLATRFDTDFYFGTALNRFVAQGLKGEDLTVYGKGLQTKPFISLDDCVRSIVEAIDIPVKEKHTIYNQVTEHIRIKDLADLVAKKTGVKVKHIPNPRKEKEDFNMVFKNKNFLNLIDNRYTTIEQGIGDMIEWLKK